MNGSAFALATTPCTHACLLGRALPLFATSQAATPSSSSTSHARRLFLPHLSSSSSFAASPPQTSTNPPPLLYLHLQHPQLQLYDFNTHSSVVVSFVLYGIASRSCKQASFGLIITYTHTHPALATHIHLLLTSTASSHHNNIQIITNRMSNSLTAPDAFAIHSPILSTPPNSKQWPLSMIPNPIPKHFRRKLRSKLRARQSPASSVSSIETSLSPYDSLRLLRAHKWTFYDLQYLIPMVLIVFSLSISPTPGVLQKIAMVAGYVLLLLIPVTRQFFLPFLPIGTWLLFFFSCR